MKVPGWEPDDAGEVRPSTTKGLRNSRDRRGEQLIDTLQQWLIVKMQHGSGTTSVLQGSQEAADYSPALNRVNDRSRVIGGNTRIGLSRLRSHGKCCHENVRWIGDG